MSQDLRSRPDEGRDSSGRGDKTQDRSRFEGFEGMNFEQRRPAYNPQQISNSDRHGSNNDKPKRRDEL